MAEPVDPMLARLESDLPLGDLRYEPKWDGFRCVVMRDRDDVLMLSRHGRPFERYFPELVEAFRALRDDDVTLDGEITIATERGPDFAALLSRLHPAASRVRRLSTETPARFVAFDTTWRAGRSLVDAPFEERRRVLEDVVHHAPASIIATPYTDDADVARRWLDAPPGSGIDGVVAKDPAGVYAPGVRAVVKVKARRSLD